MLELRVGDVEGIYRVVLIAHYDQGHHAYIEAEDQSNHLGALPSPVSAIPFSPTNVIPIRSPNSHKHQSRMTQKHS